MASFSEISAAFPWFFPVAAFVFGACIGSFLNVVIYRVPNNESIVTPGSHCGCGQPIAWRDNIPILSWLLLHGRARCCGRPFSARYPSVELLTGFLFLSCWLCYANALVALCGFLLLSALVAAAFIDLDHFIIPDTFTLGLGVVGLLLSLAVPALHGQQTGHFLQDAMHAGALSLLGSLVGSALVLWIGMIAQAVLKKDAMGFGDVKFVGGIGAFCGWQGAIFAVFGGAVVATFWFVIAMLWQRFTGKASPAAPPVEKPMEDEPAPPPLPLEDIALGTAVLAVIASFLVPILQGQESGIYFLDSIRAGVAALRGLLIASGFVLWVGLLVEVVVRKEFIPFSAVKLAGAVGALTVWSQSWSGVLRGAISAAVTAGIVSIGWWLLRLVQRKRVQLVSTPEPSSPPADEGPPALGFGVHVPFGPMLAIATALYFLVFRSWITEWFAEFTTFL